MFNPQVSIIIPVYNGANYMREAIDSALAQTYDYREIIVINDGSVDGGETDRIARSYGDKIRYIRKENGGVATALNTGIEAAAGEYISWLSHDDVYQNDKIASQINVLRKLEDRNIVLYGDYLTIDNSGKDLYPVRMNHDLLEQKPMYAVFRGCLNGCTMLFPRKELIQAGLFRQLRTTQDYDMWFRLIRRCNFMHIPQIFLYSRLHSDQESLSSDAIEEANELWINLMSQLTPAEIYSMEETENLFYEGMVNFFSDKPYKRALEYARQRQTILIFNSEIANSLQLLIKEKVKHFLKKTGLFPIAVACRNILRRHKQAVTTADMPSCEATSTSLEVAPAVTADDVFCTDITYVRPKVLPEYASLYESINRVLNNVLIRQSFVNITISRNYPLVSVILPAYNRGHCIALSLASIFAQTYPNIEIIVVDDFSNDNTINICQMFAETFGSKMHIIQNKTNLGASESRNIGIMEARGEFVTFLDSDDIFFPHKIQRQVHALRNNQNAGFSHTWYAYGTNILDHKAQTPVMWEEVVNLYPTLLHPIYCLIMTPTVMVKRDVLIQAGMFDVNMRICEDLDLWTRILRMTGAALISEVLVLITARSMSQGNYIPSMLARDQLYQRVFTADKTIDLEFRKRLYVDLVKLYMLQTKKYNYKAHFNMLKTLLAQADLPLDSFREAFLKVCQNDDCKKR